MCYILLVLFSVLWLLPGVVTALFVTALIGANQGRITLKDCLYLILVVLFGPFNLIYFLSFFD
jgi:uncharacterized membrane protein